MTPLRVVAPNTALRLRALLDFESGAEKRTAGDEWLFEGPGEWLSIYLYHYIIMYILELVYH